MSISYREKVNHNEAIIWCYKMTILSATQSNYSEAKIREIRLLMSYGFNAEEVSGMMKIHRVTVQRYRKMLKARYLADVKV